MAATIAIACFLHAPLSTVPRIFRSFDDSPRWIATTYTTAGAENVPHCIPSNGGGLLAALDVRLVAAKTALTLGSVS